MKEMTINIGFDFDETLHFNFKPTLLLNLFKLYYLNNCKMFIITKNQQWSEKKYHPGLIDQSFNSYNKALITKIHLWLEHYCKLPGIAANCVVIGVPHTHGKGKIIVDNKIQAFFDDYDVFLNAITRYLKAKKYYKIMLYKISEKKKDNGRIEGIYFNGHHYSYTREKKYMSNSYKNLIPPRDFFVS
ncbi:MAG: hypothetical protein CMB64_04815 [Euryarchaeota archaeon]|nr:hypothetical protein [Euryarchaeota archaeon]